MFYEGYAKVPVGAVMVMYSQSHGELQAVQFTTAHCNRMRTHIASERHQHAHGVQLDHRWYLQVVPLVLV